MSNFLQRLLERGSGAAEPEIQPRLPSVYEPSGYGTTAESDVDAPQGSPEGRVESRMVSAAREPVGAAQVREVVVYRGPLVEPVVERTQAPGSGWVERSLERGGRRSEPGGEGMVLGAPAPEGPDATRQRVGAAPEVASAPRADAAPPVPAPAPAERPAGPTPVEPRVVRSDATRSRGQPDRRAEMDAGPAPPTVQVTIGRIEVRAITGAPPPAPPARNPTAPRLSLDEYLGQRMRGER